MSLGGLAMVCMAALMMASSSLMLRAGIDQIGGFGNSIGGLFQDILALLQTPIFDIGVILYGLGTLLWMRVISTEPLSTGYPVLLTTAFIIITLGSAFFFKEPLTLAKIGGMALIIGGVVITLNG